MKYHFPYTLNKYPMASISWYMKSDIDACNLVKGISRLFVHTPYNYGTKMFNLKQILCSYTITTCCKSVQYY